ncbi:transcriptional Coactivator p15-domain-containing protein [Cercophora newfieldiana]|uniref:Transcriptional Coactivator p15-domain-containing protein n=1 Tax=Cercophora newfieldiana TaxID=92897 RepID=A0AA39XTI4_9PEZI|nr:transcriptional Coactivator p15-domain-containing protein [Cercophora newfieldiana]
MGKRQAQADGDGEDFTSPAVKKAKASKSKTKETKDTKPKPSSSKIPPAAPISGTDADGNPFWEIGGSRRATISKYRGTTLVNIREYFTAPDGEMKPGKKGISLSVTQFEGLLDALPSMVQVLSDDGHEVAIPDSGSGGAPVAEASTPVKKSKTKKSKKSKKANIEETSSEEDDDDEE